MQNFNFPGWTVKKKKLKAWPGTLLNTVYKVILLISEHTRIPTQSSTGNCRLELLPLCAKLAMASIAVLIMYSSVLSSHSIMPWNTLPFPSANNRSIASSGIELELYFQVQIRTDFWVWSDTSEEVWGVFSFRKTEHRDQFVYSTPTLCVGCQRIFYGVYVYPQAPMYEKISLNESQNISFLEFFHQTNGKI
jgi:hypothetical protein